MEYIRTSTREYYDTLVILSMISLLLDSELIAYSTLYTSMIPFSISSICSWLMMLWWPAFTDALSMSGKATLLQEFYFCIFLPWLVQKSFNRSISPSWHIESVYWLLFGLLSQRGVSYWPILLFRVPSSNRSCFETLKLRWLFKFCTPIKLKFLQLTSYSF